MIRCTVQNSYLMYKTEAGYKEEEKFESEEENGIGMNYKNFKDNIETIISGNHHKTAMRYLLESKQESDTKSEIVSFSFDEIFEKMQNTVTVLKECGIKPGDRAAIITPHSPYAVIAGLALAYANVTTVLIDASLPYDEIINLLEFSDVRCIFTTEQIFQKLPEHIYKEMPCFELGKNQDITERFKKSAACVTLCETADRECDVVSIIFSSGTTDRMKGIKMTYHSLIRAREVIDAVSGNKISEYKSYLLVLPFNHVAGYSGGIAYFLSGCELDFIENVNPSKLADGLKKFEPYFFVMVPKFYEVIEQKICAAIYEKGKIFEIAFKIMMEFSGFMRRRFGINIGRKLFRNITASVFGKNIKGLGTGASPCKPSTTQFFLNLGVVWANFYASTETNLAITVTGVHDRYPVGNVGNINRNKGIEVTISNPDTDGIGEVLVKSDLIMKGYFRQPQLTEQAFEDGWFKTGDYGYIDKAGYLYLTGRMKESIVLASGKKVSPTDVDDYYSKFVNDTLIASCGQQCEDGYDEIHMYVETDGKTQLQCEHLREELLTRSKKAPQMYKLTKVHFIHKIPLTTVGKVKRFMLGKCEEISYAESDENRDKNAEQKKSGMRDISADRDGIIKILRNLSAESKDITEDMRLVEDLGLDSLGMFELCMNIETVFSIKISDKVQTMKTVGDLLNSVETTECLTTDFSYDISKYPAIKTKKEILRLKRFGNISRKLYKFEVKGIENIPSDTNYILCPNHESHFDGMWIWTAIENSVNYDKICCLAKQEHLAHKISRIGLAMTGGIPVDRSGNSAPAISRAVECLTKENYNLLLHPEGTRTRNGELGLFKNGAAMIALMSKKPIIPVKLEGAYKIYPSHRLLPHLYDFKNHNKYKLKITFGTPIYTTKEQSVDDVTDMIRRQIVSI